MPRSPKQLPQPQPQSILRRIWLNSQTKGWAYFQGSSAALLAGVTSLNNTLHSSEFKELLGTLTVPWYIPTGIAVCGIITYVAHGHKDD